MLPELVEALHERAVRLPWPAVARVLARFPLWDRLHRVLELLAAGGEGPARAALLGLFVADGDDEDQSREMREEILRRLRRALDDNRGPLDAAERALRQALADHVDKTAAAARADPDYFIDCEDVDPEVPIDPLSLPWFCGVEREILERLAELEVH